jgi:hypothetical protein
MRATTIAAALAATMTATTAATLAARLVTIAALAGRRVAMFFHPKDNLRCASSRCCARRSRNIPKESGKNPQKIKNRSFLTQSMPESPCSIGQKAYISGIPIEMRCSRIRRLRSQGRALSEDSKGLQLGGACNKAARESLLPKEVK